MALNPIRFADDVNGQFRRYQLTAFPLADPELAAQARELLGEGGFDQSPLVKGPFLSLSRAFKQGAEFASLVDEGVIHPALAGIAQYPAMFAHQENVLRAVKEDLHPLVSTGTGSGKTEAFLYPIIDHCLELRDSGAEEGVTAILVYPMNALASDQRDRLRTLLAGTGITFGLYVGPTPPKEADANVVSLREGVSRKEFLAERARRMDEGVPVIPWEECPSEESIVARKPRLLLTNANQLEILLTRAKDLELFTGPPLRFIVLDEAHTYSGAAGSEVSCLVRRLRSFCGKGVDEVTCIATSATIIDPDAGSQVGPSFLARLCGVREEKVRLVTEEFEDLAYPGRRVIPEPPADPLRTLDVLLDALEAEDPPALSSAVESLTGKAPPRGDDIWADLYTHLQANDVIRALGEHLGHPRSLASASQAVWQELRRQGSPPEGAQAEVLAYLALGAAAERDGAPLLRPKMHLFVRGLEGAAVTFEEGGAKARLHFSKEQAQASEPTRLPTAIFPISVCRTCGQHYMTTWLSDFDLGDTGRPNGGDAVDDTIVWPPTPEDEGIKVRFTDRFVSELVEEDSDVTDKLDKKRAEAGLCTWCGALHMDLPATCRNPVCRRDGGMRPVFVIRETKGFTCPGCGASSRGGGRRYEAIRPLRAVSVADVHILAQEMITSAPSDDERRLIVFADNRQDAAFQAGWMRDHARRYRLRYLMLEMIRVAEGPISFGDLTAELFKRLWEEQELGAALAPEVFHTEEDEGFGKSRKEELRRFLRMQIIREFTPRMSQAIGLEPWGLVRCEYHGLAVDDLEVAGLAEELGMTTSELVLGVESLLDMWRRSNLLHDPEEPIYTRWWQDGSEEINRGYLPAGMAEVPPKGVKLTRGETDKDMYVTQIVSHKGKTAALGFVERWGISEPREACKKIWDLCRSKGWLDGVTLVGAKGNAVSGATGIHQVASSKIGVVPQFVRFRCNTCQRVHARPTPAMACTKHNCKGTLREEEPPADHYDIRLFERPFSMVMAEEHTAQVPHHVRADIEGEFKKVGGRVNTLVATPTLELGVDIGDLDLILLRNVPPTSANYWQRVGRAGRRRRMAVLYTYCRRAIHDTYFFEDPERLLGAPIRPPRFNLKNDVLVAKHIHATVISELLRAKKSGRLSDEEVQTLDLVLPPYIEGYLLDRESRHYLAGPLDVSALAEVIVSRRDSVRGAVSSVFAEGWPDEAADEVSPEQIDKLIYSMAADLRVVVNRIHQRFRWTKATADELNTAKGKRPLERDEEQQLRRSEAALRKMLSQDLDTYTLSVLANEGFLPGYGTYEAGVTAFVERSQGRTGAFTLGRPSALAIREFVPGNMIYANRGRFRAVRYHFPVGEGGQDGMMLDRYVVDPETERIRIAGAGVQGYSASDTATLPGLRMSDVDLAPSGRINDEEVERFQLPVVILGLARRHRRGGAYYRAGAGPILYVRGQGLRLVNVGTADRVREGDLGFPTCTVCGATRSPYLPQTVLDKFAEIHKQRCGAEPQHVAFSSDATVDALLFQNLADQKEAVNLGEALRIGAAQVLEMEPEDLHTLTIPADGERADLYLYDPMPGGSGLLDQLLERWSEVIDVLKALLATCPGACEDSCYECLRTGRNTFYHRFLDRVDALDVVERYAEAPEYQFDLPQQVETSFQPTGATTVISEDRLERMLRRAGFDSFIGQVNIEIGAPYKNTQPDFAYQDGDIKVAVYLDGIFHAKQKQQHADAIIRDRLEELGWTVISIWTPELDDETAMLLHFKKIARAIDGQSKADEVAEDTSWHQGEDSVDPTEQRPQEDDELPKLKIVLAKEAEPFVEHIPLLTLEVAAGAALENEEPTPSEWVFVPGVKPRKGMFVATVKGKSMEPRIPDGSLAVFRGNEGGGPIAGSRDGRIVLAALYGAEDPEGGGRFTVKRFRSSKSLDEDGRVIRDRIVLESLNPTISDIEIGPDDELAIIAEFVTALS
jgi:ATP-dependent helicase YprA (DUF1998 family)/SOS-response transcriptional repressor LexA